MTVEGELLRVNFCEGRPANGTSRCKEASLRFNVRTATVPSRKTSWEVTILLGASGQVGPGQMTRTFALESETNGAAATNDTSALCASAVVENARTKNETAKIRRLANICPPFQAPELQMPKANSGRRGRLRLLRPGR